MQDSFVELLELLLPEIIVDYFELTSYKKGEEISHLYLKEINSIPKEYRENKSSSKGFFNEITFQDFPIRGHQVYLHITRRRWFNEDSGQVVFSPDNYREEFSSRRNSGNTGVCDFFKRNQSIQSLMIAMQSPLSMVSKVKTYYINTKIF
ncbi:hypothetical protein [Flavobacterium frigidarium]|uniref:ISAon1 family transposase N-terminal region protein n=1 Tax=Flavobacterium frigidarium TaxID=99286 RepID=UPI0030DB91D2|tara:strand:- start:1071 stop:1520 length:450 start_codon:yes stop_codon:yes gene_type:complete